MVPPRGPTRGPEDILGKASHEVKTAATSMGGYAQMILRQLERDGSVDPDRLRHAMQAIAQQSAQLAHLMNGLLDVTRMDAGQFVLDVHAVDVVELVRATLEDLRPRIEANRLRLLAPDTPLMVEVDGLRLRQVVVNLLDNAVKFSPPDGAIEVSVEAGSPERFSVSVVDHGPGVAPERRGALFARFYQAQGEGFQSGLGLGLYISRQIVERHGGRLEADFPEGGGSRFTATLPRRAG